MVAGWSIPGARPDAVNNIFAEPQLAHFHPLIHTQCSFFFAFVYSASLFKLYAIQQSRVCHRPTAVECSVHAKMGVYPIRFLTHQAVFHSSTTCAVFKPLFQ